MIPKNITKEHVLKAIEEIDRNGLRYPLAKSSVYDLIYKEKSYPPKHTIAIANEYANGAMLSHTEFNTTEAQKLLSQLSDDFVIETRTNDPLPSLIIRYKKYLEETKLKGEVYKWQLLKEFGGRPRVDADNFFDEIRSINFSNLIYGVGIGVTHHIARDAPDEYKNCFKNLFDEEIPLADRLKDFSTDTLTIYRSLGVEKVSHHQDERTMATFLTYHDPNSYAFYKDSFYQKYCKLLGITPQSIYQKYPHYLELLNDFISDYVSPDKELLDALDGLLPENAFDDSNHLLLAQDILYQTLDLQYGVGRSYWRLGTKDGDISYWDNMLSNSKIAIGWSDLGDLNDLNITSKKEVETALNKKKYYPGDKNILSRKAGEIFNFYSNVKIGDIILAQDGADILGIGQVKDEYYFEQNEGFAHQKDVDWLAQNTDFDNKQGLRTTVYKIDDPSVINKVDEIINRNMVAEREVNIPAYYPLNQILFGPPGTGKTYNTINKALEIIGEDAELSLDMSDRTAVKAQFDKRINDGRIVFSTFHQNMNYEDFIEGIKPSLEDEENENVNYSIVDGILKSLSKRAMSEYYKIENRAVENEEINRLQLFDAAWDELAENVQSALDENKNKELLSLTNKPLKILRITQNGNLILKPSGDNAEEYIVSYKRTQKLFEAFPVLEVVKNIDKEFRQVIGGANSTAYWCVLKYLNTWVEENLATGKKSVELLEVNESMVSFDSQIIKENKRKNIARYVLIIDEINRGNVSQIFGELITLIEDDKRLGNREALLATLPYSKRKFGVPPNLYIIGTMNTADRSVEALDTALRRRFNFEEMAPKSSLIKTEGKLKEDGGFINGIDLSALLDKINTRIELLLDKDHLIGHSFFMQVNSIDKLKEAFQNKIIPLLQEYFYGDFGKIGLVLGAGFVKEKDQGNINKIFSQSFKYDTSSLDDKSVYELIDYTQPVNYVIEVNKQFVNVDFLKAIELLMS